MKELRGTLAPIYTPLHLQTGGGGGCACEEYDCMSGV